MSTHNQPRQPKGVPAGGQWRATSRPEGSLSLAEPRPVPDPWEDWDRREAEVAQRIDAYHPDCNRRWARDSLADARRAREAALATERRGGASLLDELSAQESREHALATLAATEKHAGLGRSMTVEVAANASQETMTSLAGGDKGWCIAEDLVSFEETGPGLWRLSGPEWYMRGHVRSVLSRRGVAMRAVGLMVRTQAQQAH